MSTKKTAVGLCVLIAGGAALGFAAVPRPVAGNAEAFPGRGDGPIVYVESSGLYYDSIVVADPLPPMGPFQLLEMNAPGGGLSTEFGPGDRGYVGGRWMEDFDGDGEFHYFLCPLLGPGRDDP